MVKYYQGSSTDCNRLRDLETKAAGLPVPGIPQSTKARLSVRPYPGWLGKPPPGSDPSVPDGVGWTTAVHDLKTHPTTKDLHAYPCEAAPEALTIAEKAEWDAKAAVAAELDKTWEPDNPSLEPAEIGEAESQKEPEQ